jgi:hypothetical protein
MLSSSTGAGKRSSIMLRSLSTGVGGAKAASIRGLGEFNIIRT